MTAKDEKPCPAMRKAGIVNPESQEGIEFCTSSCPYEYCIMVENRGKNKVQVQMAQYRKKRAIRMRANGKTVEEIAHILGKTVRTVERYLI